MVETDRYFFQHPDTGEVHVLALSTMRTFEGRPVVVNEEGHLDMGLTRHIVFEPDIHEAWKTLKREHRVTE